MLATSFERIHRANLIGMGVVPIRLPQGVTPQTLALHAEDKIEIDLRGLTPRGTVEVFITRANGRQSSYLAALAIETSLEVTTLAKGGLIPLILQSSLELIRVSQ
ncbi:hypothetical protein [Paracoccus laeviglucosivorans]|uniref:hypothetical protein n=1 Tax=Paracoccus laeviglucosivorans TaxID=1197861 RepID=UPI001C8F8D8E|nr:hypothetical protein [Paracoccus laeviglucosivorans]